MTPRRSLTTAPYAFRADGKESYTAGEIVVLNDLLCFDTNSGDSKVYKCNAGDTTRSTMFAGIATANANAAASVIVQNSGKYTASSGTPWTANRGVFISYPAGGAGTAMSSIFVGWAESTTTILISPQAANTAVDGAAIFGLANLPAGAGVIPPANLPGINSAGITDGSIVNVDINANAAIDATKIGANTNISNTEYGFLNNVTSAIQTQLDGKQATITGSGTTIDTESLTASRALISNASSKVAVSSVTNTELGHLSGVTSPIQTQLDTRQASDPDLSKIAELAKTNNNFMVADGTNWVLESPASARTSLGLGTLATSSEVSGGNAGTISDSSIIDDDLATGSFPKITGVGTLGSLSVTGTINAAAFVGDGSGLTGLGRSSSLQLPRANTITAVDSGGNVGEHTSITIGTDGFPVISYYDGSNSDLKVLKAANPFFLNYWTRR